MLTVQYTEGQVKSLADLRAIPVRAAGSLLPTRLDAISSVKRVQAPTEVDHYQIRRVTDIYVRPLGEELGSIADRIDQIIAQDEDSGRTERDAARHGAGNARFVPQFRDRPDSFRGACSI